MRLLLNSGSVIFLLLKGIICYSWLDKGKTIEVKFLTTEDCKLKQLEEEIL